MRDACHVIRDILRSIGRLFFAVLSWTVIYSVVAEILLLTKVYAVHDGKFFALSIGFLKIKINFTFGIICLTSFGTCG